MPITSSAKKALRNSARKRVFNLRKKEALTSALKTFRKLVQTKKLDEAKKHLSTIQKALDKAAKTGVIKKNAASRRKSRLEKMIKALTQ